MTGGARAAWEKLFAGAPPPGSGTAAWLGTWEALFSGWRLTRLSEETVPWYGPPKRLWSGCARPR